jgi:hypothetical protein
MKAILWLVFISVLGLIIYGYYINNSEYNGGEKYIGAGVFLFAFVLMPLFIYHRYKDRDLKKYRLFPTKEMNEEHEKRKGSGHQKL